MSCEKVRNLVYIPAGSNAKLKWLVFLQLDLNHLRVKKMLTKHTKCDMCNDLLPSSLSKN